MFYVVNLAIALWLWFFVKKLRNYYYRFIHFGFRLLWSREMPWKVVEAEIPEEEATVNLLRSVTY